MFPPLRGAASAWQGAVPYLISSPGAGVQIFIQPDSHRQRLPHQTSGRCMVRSDGRLVPMAGITSSSPAREEDSTAGNTKYKTRDQRATRLPRGGGLDARPEFLWSGTGLLTRCQDTRCAPGRCQHMCMMTAYHWQWQELASARQELRVCPLSPANSRVARVVGGGHRGLGARACMSVAAGCAGSLARSQQVRLPELQSRNRWGSQPIEPVHVLLSRG